MADNQLTINFRDDDSNSGSSSSGVKANSNSSGEYSINYVFPDDHGVKPAGQTAGSLADAAGSAASVAGEAAASAGMEAMGLGEGVLAAGAAEALGLALGPETMGLSVILAQVAAGAAMSGGSGGGGSGGAGGGAGGAGGLGGGPLSNGMGSIFAPLQGVFEGIIAVGEGVVEIFGAVTDAVQSLIDETRQYSYELSLAVANSNVQNIGNLINRANVLGPDLAQFQNISTEINSNLSYLVTTIADGMLPIINAIYRGVGGVLSVVTDLFTVLQPVAQAILDIYSVVLTGNGSLGAFLNGLTYPVRAALKNLHDMAEAMRKQQEATAIKSVTDFITGVDVPPFFEFNNGPGSSGPSVFVPSISY